MLSVYVWVFSISMSDFRQLQGCPAMAIQMDRHSILKRPNLMSRKKMSRHVMKSCYSISRVSLVICTQPTNPKRESVQLTLGSGLSVVCLAQVQRFYFWERVRASVGAENQASVHDFTFL